MSLKKLILIAAAVLILFSQGYSLASGVITAGGQITEALEDLDLEEIVPSDPFLPSITQRCSPVTKNAFSQMVCLALFLVLMWPTKSNSPPLTSNNVSPPIKRKRRPLWLQRRKLLL